MKPLLLIYMCFLSFQTNARGTNDPLYFVPFSSYASQEITVEGKVTDENRLPLSGASIIEKGTSNGTVSDFDGNFRITVQNRNSVIVISYLGYKAQEISSEKAYVEVQLLPDASALEEIVVIGYGTQKKKDLTGSISSIGPESYRNQPVLDASTALQGRVAGLQITNTSGAPGSEAKIHIRGANSINSSNSPIYVVDGIALSGIGLQDINVNDIESIEVLKDASSTAIYGSRGANGVILITTKDGRSGNIKVDYDYFLQVNSPMNRYDLRSAEVYAREANHIAGSDVFENPSSFAGNSTDWQDLIFRNGLTQNHHLAISGGTERSKYYISGNYIDESGLLINTDRNKLTLKSNIESKLNEKLSVGLGVLLGHIHSSNNGDTGGKGNPVTGAIAWAPTEPVYDSPNVYNRNAVSPIWSNPYMILRERNNDRFSNFALLDGNLKYHFTDWLTLDVVVGLDWKSVKSAYLNNEWISPGNPGSGQGQNESTTFQNSNILTFHKVFDEKHDLNVVGLAEVTTNKFSAFNANGSGLSSTSNGYFNLGLNTSQSISSAYSNWGLLSFMGRVSYAYDGKYLLSATFRADGSSKFQKTENKWGYFPSIGLGWRLSDENFIKDADIFSNLKLRGSYGVTGSQAIDPYSSLGLLTPVQYGFGTPVLFQGFVQGNPSNSNLKWETTDQFDIGLDMGFWDDRVNIAIDYYDKKTKDLLLNTPIPGYNGGGSYLQNVGSVSNKGVEFWLDLTPIRTDNLSWTTSFNASANKNKVLSLGKDSQLFRSDFVGQGFINTNIQVVKVGESLGTFFLIPWQGVYSSDDDALGYKAGDNRYGDINGDGEINFEDRSISGSAMPTVSMGWNNRLQYKNFEFNLFFQSALGNKIFNATYAIIAAPNSDVYYPNLAESTTYWTAQNPNAIWPDPASKTGRNFTESTQYLQDGGYLRLKNISISYMLPKEVAAFADFNLSLSAQNLFTITDYKGYDPEASSTPSGSDASAGIDFGAYPSPKTFALGLRIGF